MAQALYEKIHSTINFLTIAVWLVRACGLFVMGLTCFFWLTEQYTGRRLFLFIGMRTLPLCTLFFSLSYMLQRLFRHRLTQVAAAMATPKITTISMHWTSKQSGFNHIVEFLDPQDASKIHAAAKVRINARNAGFSPWTETADVYYQESFGTGYVIAHCRGLLFFGEFIPVDYPPESFLYKIMGILLAILLLAGILGIEYAYQHLGG